MATAKAQDKAYAFLKQRILDGVLSAETAIVPEDIGKRLGISRMPVRAALLQLEKEGLVTFGENRRPVVTSLTVSEIVELFEIRVALETLAVERAVAHLDDATFRLLTIKLETMLRFSSDPRRWMEHHSSFHDTIYQAAQMPRLMAEIRRVRQAIHPYLLLYNSVYEVREMPGVEHSALLKILRKKDPALARTCLTEHIRNPASGVAYFLLNQPNARVAPMPLDDLLSKAGKATTTPS
ncbi:GntR family transcriptional regulator [Bradyrhizobium sp. dw_78]|uniref:GntR family transcriptional regulator n=1 Tax=Bradyrhizobium sp. dw_78 TaxID=2719793 RepID=UPI001BD23C30|nr:GntR family transcriptional regulator [Bradyrhizobium sp. dw_78]